MKARLLIEVQCSSCDRSTKASAVAYVGGSPFGESLSFRDVRFPCAPDGTESSWLERAGEVYCPDCGADGKGE
jgi:hypothetical protein